MTEKKRMTEEESYQAMFYFLQKWYEMTKSDDVGEILGLMEYLSDGEPADPVMWDNWQDAIEKVRLHGKPPPKELL